MAFAVTFQGNNLKAVAVEKSGWITLRAKQYQSLLVNDGKVLTLTFFVSIYLDIS